jgi:hypothetical protein
LDSALVRNDSGLWMLGSYDGVLASNPPWCPLGILRPEEEAQVVGGVLHDLPGLSHGEEEAIVAVGAPPPRLDPELDGSGSRVEVAGGTLGEAIRAVDEDPRSVYPILERQSGGFGRCCAILGDEVVVKCQVEESMRIRCDCRSRRHRLLGWLQSILAGGERWCEKEQQVETPPGACLAAGTLSCIFDPQVPTSSSVRGEAGKRGLSASQADMLQRKKARGHRGDPRAFAPTNASHKMTMNSPKKNGKASLETVSRYAGGGRKEAERAEAAERAVRFSIHFRTFRTFRLSASSALEFPSEPS